MEASHGGVFVLRIKLKFEIQMKILKFGKTELGIWNLKTKIEKTKGIQQSLGSVSLPQPTSVAWPSPFSPITATPAHGAYWPASPSRTPHITASTIWDRLGRCFFQPSLSQQKKAAPPGIRDSCQPNIPDSRVLNLNPVTPLPLQPVLVNYSGATVPES